MSKVIRVLYVDDESGLLEIGKMFLEKSEDFAVVTCDSAAAALDLLKKEEFDAIVSDYQMPGLNGIPFLVEVRAQWGKIPFILFTGREEVVIESINFGADFHLQKGGEPTSQFAELEHKIRFCTAPCTRSVMYLEVGYPHLTSLSAGCFFHNHIGHPAVTKSDTK
jgi:DNA-binding response OmpR family regulator